MKKLKIVITTAILLLIYVSNVQAQQNAKTAGKTRGKIVIKGDTGLRQHPPIKNGPCLFSLGAGSNTPSATLKDKAYLTSSPAINADVCIQLSKRGWGPNGNWFGFNISGAYNFGGKGNPTNQLPTAFAVTGQTASNIAYKGLDPKSPGFRIGAGPQVNFNFGNHFTISPMVLAEYFSMTQKTLSAVQTTSYNGKEYDFNLSTLPETKTSGFAVTPKIRFQYMFTNSIGLYVQGGYTMGPKVKTTLSKLVPNGSAQTPGNTYNLQQLQTATYVNGETKSTAYNAASFGGGIVVRFGGKKGWDGKATYKIGSNGGAMPESLKTAGDNKPNNSTAKTDFGERVNAGKMDKGWDGVVKPLSPVNDAKINEDEIKNGMTFRWTPCLPKPQNPPTYRIKVWQLMQGQNDQQAMRSNQPIVTKDVENVTQATITNLNAEPCMLPRVCAFVWSVVALGEKGEVLGESTPANFSVVNDAAKKGWDGKAEATVANDMKIGNEMPNTLKTAGDNKPSNLTGNTFGEKVSNGKIEKGWDGISNATDELPSAPSNARSITNNCCDSTVTGSIDWVVPGTSGPFVTITSSGLSSVLRSDILAGSPPGIEFRSTINCLPYTGCATPFPITYKVNGVVAGTSANGVPFVIPASFFPAPGGYIIKVIGGCGGSKCKAKKLQLTVL